MRPSSLLKALAFVAVLISLWSCTQIRRPSESLSTANPVPGDSDLGTRTILQTTDLGKMRTTLEYYEESRGETDELPSYVLTELARFCFVLGECEVGDEKGKYFEKGRHYAELLCQREPSRVEGHYWLALNLCGIAETSRAGVALGLIPDIVGELELAVNLDETYDQAGPHRVIGRIYSEAPGWPLSEGDINKSLSHLRRAVKIAPGNSTNHLYLAETLIQLGMSEKARRELERVLTSVQHTILAKNLKDDQKQAVRLISQITRNP
jgi:tetratricopeptide (TPR) repeat protein